MTTPGNSGWAYATKEIVEVLPKRITGVFDSLTIGRQIGAGGTCQAFLARTRLGESTCHATLKVPRPLYTSSTPARTSLRREAWALARIAHPAVPRLIFDGSQEDTPFLLYTHVSGLPISTLVETQALPSQQVVLVEATLLSIVATLCDANVVHGDICPQNVLWSSTDGVFLIDFGLAFDPRTGNAPAVARKTAFSDARLLRSSDESILRRVDADSVRRLVDWLNGLSSGTRPGG